MITTKLEKCAEILGVNVRSLNDFPKDVQDRLITCMEIFDIDDADSARTQYEEMERIWRTGTLVLGMKEISENMDIPQDMLSRLSENEQLNLMYEYAIGSDRETLLKIIE